MLKRVLMFTITVSMMLLLASCSPEDGAGKDNESRPDAGNGTLPEKQAVQQEAGVDFKPAPSRRYLLENGIEIKRIPMDKYRDDMNVHVDYIVIQGLLDRKVQDKINGDIRSYAESIADGPMPAESITNYTGENKKMDERVSRRRCSFNVTANYDNVLCLTVRHNEMTKEYNSIYVSGMAYNLVDGNRLVLKDLFADGADYIKMVNEGVRSYLLRNNMEEDFLCRPFSSIAGSQPFYFTDNALVIRFDGRNPEFNLRSGGLDVNLPFSDFKGAVNIYERFADTTAKLYEKSVLKKKMLPGSVKINHRIYRENKPEYFIDMQSLQLENMKDKLLEYELNSILSDFPIDQFKKAAIQAYKVNKEKEPSVKNRFAHVTANFGDVLCIMVSDAESIRGKSNSSSRKTLCYNLITGKPLELKDVFIEGYDYRTAIGNYIIRQCKERGLDAGNGKSVAIPVDKTEFFIDDRRLHISFKPGTISKRTDVPYEFDIPYEEFEQDMIRILQ